MITKIGLVAGTIWNYLDQEGSTSSLDDIVSRLDIDRDMVLMSVGWLAREGHITLDGSASNYTVRLKSS